MATDYKLIGIPCGQHGPYTFYKAFKYRKNGKANILALSEFFFVKMWSDNDLISIGELQLLWEDKNTEQTLASLRLYILPENTPDGRQDCHGEDEVLAITEKVVLRVEDLLTCITDATDWNWGLTAVSNQDCSGKRFQQVQRPQLLNDCTAIDLDDVDKEKEQLDDLHWETSIGVVVLSFPRYCRYRGVLKRLEGVHNKWLRTALVVALGGFTVPCRNTRVLFCKDSFDYPDLEGHELLCNHLAPKLKGRPRKKRKIYSNTPEGSDCESESSQSTSSSTKTKVSFHLEKSRNGLSPRRSTRSAGSLQEKEFLDKLFAFMKGKHTPITRIPSIGFKEIDLFSFYHKVQHLGGYDAVTAGRMWKYVYEELGGDQNSTSAATISRRHYERILLPYERQFGGIHLTNKVKKLHSESSSTAASSSSSSVAAPPPTSTAVGASNNSTAVSIMSSMHLTSSVSITPAVTITANSSAKEKRLSNKISTLRSIRLKPEKMLVDAGGKENIPVSNSSILPSNPDLSSELIDLCSEDSQSPNKGNVSVQPHVKKQKLEILKEGGLEVTPITTTVTSATASANCVDNRKTEEGRPSVIRHPVPEPQGILPKITITENNRSRASPSIVENCQGGSSSSSSCSNSNKISIRVPEVGRACLNIPEVNRSKLQIGADARNKIAISDARVKNSSPDGCRSKISITVTPDLSTMLTPPSAHNSNGAAGHNSTSISDKKGQKVVGQQQRAFLSPSPSSSTVGSSPWTKRTIYGNPKDIIQPTIKRPVAEEVLDLRMRGASDSDRTKIFAKTVLPSRPIGSNLEITLVPTATKTSGLPPPPVGSPLPPPTPAQRRKKTPNPAPAHAFSNGHVEAPRSPSLLAKQPSHSPNLYHSSLIIPNVSLSTNNNNNNNNRRNNKTTKKSNQTNASQQANNFPNQFAHPNVKSTSPYMGPAVPLDPVYLTALFNNQLFNNQLLNNQLYKELYCRPTTGSDALPESFPRLLQDGSTSITLVANNSTPTSK